MTDLNSVRLLGLGAGLLVPAVLALLPGVWRYGTVGERLSSARVDVRRQLRPPPLALLGVVPLPALGRRGLAAVGATLATCGALGAAGIGPVRMWFATAALLALVFLAPLGGLAAVRRKGNTVPVLLTVLTIAPGVDGAWSARPPRWPLLAVGLVLTQVFLSAGIEKLRRTGWSWATGRSLGHALAWHALWDDLPLAGALARRPGAVRFAATAVLVAELVAPVALLWPLVAVAGLVFHFATDVVLRIRYLPLIAATYAVVPAALLGAPGPLWDPVGVAAVGALTLVLTVVTLSGRSRWPFTPYPMFADPPPAGPAVAHRIAVERAGGRDGWLPLALRSDRRTITQLLDRCASQHRGLGPDVIAVTEAALAISPVIDLVACTIVRRGPTGDDVWLRVPAAALRGRALDGVATAC
jgi:hypothetical protein